MLESIVATATVVDPALPEQADNLHGFLEHLEALVGLWPAVAKDVLVERLAAADSQAEASVEEDRGCRGGLSHDPRMDPHRGIQSPSNPASCAFTA